MTQRRITVPYPFRGNVRVGYLVLRQCRRLVAVFLGIPTEPLAHLAPRLQLQHHPARQRYATQQSSSYRPPSLGLAHAS
jgi:hypothetical protein